MGRPRKPCSIRKAKYRDEDGILKESRKFKIFFRDHLGIERALPGTTDKNISDYMGRNIAAIVNLRAANQPLSSELRTFIESQPRRVRDKLAEWGILDEKTAAGFDSLSTTIELWKKHLQSKNNTSRHVNEHTKKVTRITTDCRFIGWGDVCDDRVETWLSDRREKGMSARTSNAYLTAFNGFCRWGVRTGRILRNPVVGLSKVNERTDRRVERRALSGVEMRRFLRAAESGPSYRNVSGSTWALLFQLAAVTGLRWSELRSLKRSSFNLDSIPPTVTFEAEATKNRQEDCLPLRAETADVLRSFLGLKSPNVSAFPLPKRDCGAEAVRFFLDRTGGPDKEFKPIPYEDDLGQRFDFHALRGQFATSLARAGVSLAASQNLLRHSDVNLTARHYTHLVLEDRNKAIEKLPSLDGSSESESIAKTGTDDIDLAPKKSTVKSTENPKKIYRNRAQSSEKVDHTSSKEKPVTYGKSNRLREKELTRPAGFEPATYGLEIRSLKSLNPSELQTSENPNKQSTANSTENLSKIQNDLARIIEKWNTLPENIRQAILILIGDNESEK